MRLPVPAFVPAPSPEAMHLISIVLLAVGICLAGASALFLLLGKDREDEKRKKLSWVAMGAGALLILNHGIQLLF